MPVYGLLVRGYILLCPGGFDVAAVAFVLAEKRGGVAGANRIQYNTLNPFGSNTLFGALKLVNT